MSVRQMTRRDLETALGWARAEGWNPGLRDAGHFHAADPGGFLMVDHAGAPAASISIVETGAALYFLGLFICRADLRGQGLAGPLWDAAMVRAAGASIGLDGVVAEQPRYAAKGFRATHRTIRFAGTGAEAPARSSREIADGDLSQIFALDRRATGFDRTAFLSRWMRPAEDRRARILRGDAGLAAGLLRACHEGWKIGPLLAESRPAAAALLDELLGLAGARRVMIDIPEDAPGGAEMARERGMSPVFETARMWRGSPPARSAGLEYGVATLELG